LRADFFKQGIRDGFLAPYKVIKVHIDRDVEGYRPKKGQRDREGEEVEDRIYNTKDFDRTLVLDDARSWSRARSRSS
jgi:type I restriction enzyme, R subunit